MKKGIRWLFTVFGPLAWITQWLNDSIKTLIEQEGWNRWLAASWHPALNAAVAALSSPYTAYAGCFATGVAATLWIMKLTGGPESAKADLSLGQTLYVGEVRVSVENIAQERHSEISLRVFNGSRTPVSLSAVSGQLTFSGKGGDGKLPTPTIRSDTAAAGLPFKEWFIVLDQRIPSDEAVKLTKTLENAEVIQFDLRQLRIEVTDGSSKSLLILDGVTATRRAVAYGRIAYASAHIRLG